ncbi:peptidoglycan DD-metalloendopeptidase family protein [Rhodoblastus acidophilus]|uniref:peptidoglycan DD-metalloendopeptidase family protein n=1 Tax=Candidatus Rhodoblastus alkanivorans TaxID=2954117 RepID=UPI001FAACB34|nr:peptidoglycan DD-metalloendopeptidase family protein [Candidatus Rhodoblastus alkanivorans]
MKNSGGAIRVALIGVATILLGGCSETGQFGNSFGAPYASARVDRTPTGSVNEPQSPTSQVSSFFKEAFRPFGDKPAAPPPPERRHYAARHPAQAYDHPIPPAPIASAPLAPPSQVASYPAPAPTYAPAPRPTYALRTNPNAIGGWSADGGTPIVVAQGESAEILAQRYGVPVSTLLTLNGYAPRARLEPGSRLTIPVYQARGARVAEAPAPYRAPEPARSTESHRFGAHSLVGEELAQTRRADRMDWSKGKAPARTATRSAADARNLDEAARRADKKAKLAEEKAAQAHLAQMKAEKEKARFARTGGGMHAAEAEKKVAEAKAAREAARLAAKEARAAREAQVREAKAKAAEAAKVAQARQTPAGIKETTKVAKSENLPAPKADRNPTASLPPQSASASADSANPEFRWPARGRVIQAFGTGGNDGINIAVPEGTQVKAAENGVVAYAGSELKGYGNLVLIRHPNGFVTAYANNGSLEVHRGETVKRGQVIALSGQSGNVASPQLHFELRKGSKPVDPSKYLAGL